MMNNFNPNERDVNTYCDKFMQALDESKYDLANEILQHVNYNPNNQDYYKRDAFMWALSEGQIDIAKNVLNHSLYNVNNTDDQNNDAFLWCGKKDLSFLIFDIIKHPTYLFKIDHLVYAYKTKNKKLLSTLKQYL